MWKAGFSTNCLYLNTERWGQEDFRYTCSLRSHKWLGSSSVRYLFPKSSLLTNVVTLKKTENQFTSKLSFTKFEFEVYALAMLKQAWAAQIWWFCWKANMFKANMTICEKQCGCFSKSKKSLTIALSGIYLQHYTLLQWCLLGQAHYWCLHSNQEKEWAWISISWCIDNDNKLHL